MLASVFVGGTPTWGGVGTVAGGAIGALIVSFIQTGVFGAGLSGFYVQLFDGVVIILALIGHRWKQPRYRQLAAGSDERVVAQDVRRGPVWRPRHSHPGSARGLVRRFPAA